MPEQISTVIDALEGDWDFGAPVPPDDLARAAQMIGGLPPEVAALYVRTDGGSVGTVDLFTLDELTDANKRRPKGLAKATFFASDGADGFFFVDGGNALKHGATSIYWFERGTTVLKGAVRCAGSLAEFLRMLAAGQRPWSGPSLAAVNIDGMIAKLEATRDRWTGRP